MHLAACFSAFAATLGGLLEVGVFDSSSNCSPQLLQRIRATVLICRQLRPSGANWQVTHIVQETMHHVLI